MLMVVVVVMTTTATIIDGHVGSGSQKPIQTILTWEGKEVKGF